VNIFCDAEFDFSQYLNQWSCLMKAGCIAEVNHHFDFSLGAKLISVLLFCPCRIKKTIYKFITFPGIM
jgi:hypothetical protein